MAHLARHPLSPSKTPVGHRNIMQTEINEPQEGDYFSIKKNGEDWPIVTCDEEMIRTYFTSLPRPESARQEDGTWLRDYKLGGRLISERRFPLLDLGKLELTWAPLRELDPIDLDVGRAIKDSTRSSLLAKAWSEYTNQYKGDKIFEWKGLDHWKARLRSQHLYGAGPGLSKKERLPARKTHEVLKCKGIPKSKYPPGYRDEELDDEESEDLFLPQGTPGGPKIKRESINSMSSEEMDALYDDADPPYPLSSQSSKRSKLDLSGRFSTRPSTNTLATPAPSSVRHDTPFQSINKTDVNDPNAVIIYVDNPHKKFKVSRNGLDASPLLRKQLAHHHENGWYIMSPTLSSLDANDFQPVGEYIDRREYHPNILDDGTAHVRLEGDLDPDTLRHEVVRCGTVYQVALLLEMPGLQDLAFRKLKALAPHQHPREILTVIELLFDGCGVEVRRYLIEHVAEHYYALVLAETEKLVQVMRAYEGLAKGVYGILGRDDEVKAEAVVVKEEGKDETSGSRSETGGKTVKVELGSLGQVGKGKSKHSIHEPGFHHASRADVLDDTEMHANMDVEGLGPAPDEDDMVTMAFGPSDETEDDTVPFVRRRLDALEAVLI